MLIFLICIILYLGIGLTIYFTFPNRNMTPINVTIPFIIAWLPVSIIFLFHSEKQKDKK